MIVQCGNQTAPHSTEAAYRDGYQAAGCTVIGIEQAEAFERGPQFILDQCDATRADLLVYSRTHNNTALGPEWTECWRTLEGRETKTASVHLDVFWGLPEREAWIANGDALFTTGLVLTADGGSDEKWKAAGVNHRWLPPGADCRFIPPHAEPFAELAGKIVFVGSSMGYHPLWQHRQDMVEFARKTWGERFIEIGNGTVWGPRRGEDLARVYASDCIVIGDCCFADQRRRYVSDRLPETLARGGVLLMATNDGLDQYWYDGVDYVRWHAGDFDDLAMKVERAVDENWTKAVWPQGQARVMNHDTYRHRAKEVLGLLGIPGGVLASDRAVFPRSAEEAAEGLGES